MFCFHTHLNKNIFFAPVKIKIIILENSIKFENTVGGIDRKLQIIGDFP